MASGIKININLNGLDKALVGLQKLKAELSSSIVLVDETIEKIKLLEDKTNEGNKRI